MFDGAEIPIPCGHCGRQTKKTVAWLKSHHSLTCACGTRINVDASKLIGELKKVNCAIDDFRRSLARLGR